MNLVFIGGGHMTSALVSGLQARNDAVITVVDRNADKRAALQDRFGVQTADQPAAAATAAGDLATVEGIAASVVPVVDIADRIAGMAGGCNTTGFMGDAAVEGVASGLTGTGEAVANGVDLATATMGAPPAPATIVLVTAG